MLNELEIVLQGLPLKQQKAVHAGLAEYRLGRETGTVETDFLALTRLVADQDPEALNMLEQPSPWNYAVRLLAANLA